MTACTTRATFGVNLLVYCLPGTGCECLPEWYSRQYLSRPWEAGAVAVALRVPSTIAVVATLPQPECCFFTGKL